MFSHLMPDALYLEIPDRQRQEVRCSTPGAHWRATINQLCLDTVLPWLEEEGLPGTVKTPTHTWEFINGSKIAWGNHALILIPSTDIDQSELRVPQEWVDIPHWQGDYYIAVRVNPAENWLTIWGYTTHYQLKTQGHYDGSDRTYSLNDDQLIQDMNVLWLTQDLELAEIRQADLAPLPHLPLAQAQNLIERLGNPALALPRLSIPFPQWAGLMAHGGWQRQLYQRRQGQPRQSIGQWLQSGLSSWAAQSGWQISTANPALQGVRSGEQAILTRSLTLNHQPYELRVLPIGDSWRFELRCLAGQMPAGVVLRLLTEDLQPFEHHEDRSGDGGDTLYVDVALEPGEGLVWEVEPTPDDYQQEVLYF